MEITASHLDFAARDIRQPSTDGKMMQTCASFAGLLSLVFAPGQQLQIQQAAAGNSRVEASPVAVAESSSWNAGDLISQIKHGWSINMTELAELMGVQRPTLYNWLNGKTSPDLERFQRLQIIAVAAKVWAEQTRGKNWDYLLDYAGPQANEKTIREFLKSTETTVEDLRELIPLRIAQYQQAYLQSREILGEPLPPPKSTPPESARRMNALWAKNAKKLHAARNRNS